MHSILKTTSRRKKAGMTIPEVLMAAALGVGVIGASTWFLLEGTKSAYKAMADVENGIQQWSLSTKLQIDGKVANGVTIYATADSEQADYLKEIPLDDGDKSNGLERGKILVLSKSVLQQGVDSGVISDLIIYIYTQGSAPNYGTLKRYPANAPSTFVIKEPLADDGKTPKTVTALVKDNIDTILGGAKVVQDHVYSVAGDKGPFGKIGDSKHVSIVLVREEKQGSVTRSNLIEMSFNLR